MALDVFAIRLGQQDRERIARLAEQEERSISDVTRRLIRRALNEKGASPSLATAEANAQEPAQHP